MKNLFFLLSFFLCLFTASAQTWQELDSLRQYYQNKRSYDTALVFAEKALLTVKEKVGENDTLYATMLNGFIEIFYFTGNYVKAIEYCRKDSVIRKTLQGEKHPDYAASLNNLAILYRTTGNYPAAEPLYLEAIKIWKETFGENHPSYAQSLNNLASIYKAMGNYSAAEPLYFQAMKIWKDVLGENHSDYALLLNNLASIYEAMGNYPAAEPLYLEAMKIWKDVLGENHPYYAGSLNNIAALYITMGNYTAAEPLMVEAMKIRKDVLGESHTDYANSLNNLAHLYKITGNYLAAEPLMVEAMKIRKDVLGENHADYANSLNNLALLYKTMGNYTAAEPLYIEAMKIRKDVFGEKHPGYALSLNNLAGLYNAMGNCPAAEPLYIEAMKIRKEVLGEKHPDNALSLINLALLYFNMGKYKEAEPLYMEGLNIVNSNIAANFSFLSESEKGKYFQTQAEIFDGFYAFAMKRKKENPQITQTVLNDVVRNKGLLLKSSTAMRTAIINSGDTALITMYNKWVSLKKEITKLYSTEISKRKKNPEEFEEQANVLEKELVKKSQSFSDFEKTLQLNWESVKNSLKPGEVAIEFVRFKNNTLNKKGDKQADTTLYCALIISPGCQQPEMVKLFDEKELKKILGNNNQNNLAYIQGIYGSQKATSEQLYNLIWKPVEKYLPEGVKTVYYSPDGLLHKISFSSIGNGINSYLCDQFNLVLLSSTGKLAMPETFTFNKNLTAEIYGGIYYSSDSTKNIIWEYLPGTKTETDRIDKLFHSNKIKTNYLHDSLATEKTFKENAGSGSILHIATHGFFYSDPEEIKDDKANTSAEQKTDSSLVVFRGGSTGFGVWQFARNKNPLMRSGLAFAGANNVWNQQYASLEGEDGVLTALEVTQLDLSNTTLVVLSACETGLGDIRGSEGVYGLQRAFKMAGVKYIIMSLWQVPDKETVEFMELFYKKLLKSKDVRKSFNETQKEMRKKYDPYYWGAFVLIE